jgi:hypothetical protein
MELCWAENPIERPTFAMLENLFRRLRGCLFAELEDTSAFPLGR